MTLERISQELDTAAVQSELSHMVVPPCPELLAAVQREVSQGDPDPSVIARIAASDVAMAASLIRVANSPFYGRAKPASTVAQAIGVLGVKPTIQILTRLMLRTAVKVSSPLLTHFWDNSARRALAMEHIARQLGFVEPDVAHSCGLFCHIGLPIMMQGIKGYNGTLTEALAHQDRSFTDTENAAHQTDHAVVGAIVAKTWRVAPSIVYAVRLHHDYSSLKNNSLSHELTALVASICIADKMVAQFEGVKEQPDWRRYGVECMAYLEVDVGEVEVWLEAVTPALENATAL